MPRKRRSYRSKQRAEQIHRQRRAMERCGEVFSKEVYQNWVKMIQSGNHNCVKRMWKTSNTRTVFAVLHEGCWIPVAYNKTTKQIVTVLPAETLANVDLPTVMSS